MLLACGALIRCVDGSSGLDFRWSSPTLCERARVAEWQTRWLQVPVSERAWGFKSPLAHQAPVVTTGGVGMTSSRPRAPRLGVLPSGGQLAVEEGDTAVLAGDVPRLWPPPRVRHDPVTTVLVSTRPEQVKRVYEEEKPGT
jgi:hypothetical protein